MVNAIPQPLYLWERPSTIVYEAGWDPEPVWRGAENLAPSPVFDPRTVQPVASRCNDCAILADDKRNGHIFTAVALDCGILILVSDSPNTSTFSNKYVTLLLLLPFDP